MNELVTAITEFCLEHFLVTLAVVTLIKWTIIYLFFKWLYKKSPCIALITGTIYAAYWLISFGS